MQRTLLTAKIHQCTLTATRLDYVGSVTVDQALLEASGILPYEQVHVVNIANGERLVTYALSGLAHSGAIELNGAAARLGVVGDRLIIMAYGLFSASDLESYCPRIVLVNDRNRVHEVLYHRDLLKPQSSLLMAAEH
jgi:aspartate 1-decarboxylase